MSETLTIYCDGKNCNERLEAVEPKDEEEALADAGWSIVFMGLICPDCLENDTENNNG